MQSSVQDTAIGIFTRPPVAGRTKTRLIPALGAQGAADLHAKLLNKTLRTAQHTGAAITLWAAEMPEHPSLRALAAQFECPVARQQGDDLGARMQHALGAMLQDHAYALLIGSDCAVHSVASLNAARAALQTVDMVFTPAEDGGYVLVGARRAHAAAFAAIFAQIEWGTEHVMQQTRERLRAAAVSWHALPTLWDIDTGEDVERALLLGLL